MTAWAAIIALTTGWGYATIGQRAYWTASVPAWRSLIARSPLSPAARTVAGRLPDAWKWRAGIPRRAA